MNHLGAEVGELHRLVVGQRIDHRGVGHAARVGRQHPVDIGPDVDLRRSQQRAEDRRGKIAAVAPERGLHAAAVGGDEAGDDERAGEIRRHQRLEGWRATLPTGFPARAAPTRRSPRVARPPTAPAPARRARARRRSAEQPGRPDLAVAGDQVADVAGGASASASPRAECPRGRGNRGRSRPGSARDGRREQRPRRSPRVARAAARSPCGSARPDARRARRDAAAHRSRRGTPTARRPGGRRARSRMAATFGSSRRPRRSTPRTCARPRDRPWSSSVGFLRVKGGATLLTCRARGSPTGGTRSQPRVTGRAGDWHNRPAWKHTSFLCCPCSSASAPPRVGARHPGAHRGLDLSQARRPGTHRRRRPLRGTDLRWLPRGRSAEHARTVIDTGGARLVRYDLRGADDLLWGMGLGCEGAMQILLVRCGPGNGWQPLEHLAAALAAHAATAIGVVFESSRADLAAGSVALPVGRIPPPRSSQRPPCRPLSCGRSRSGRRSGSMSAPGDCSSCRSHCRRACCCSAPGPTRCRWWTSQCGSTGKSPWWIIVQRTRSHRTFLPPSGCS